MLHLLVTISKFTIIFMFAFYTYLCFAALKNNLKQAKGEKIFKKQTKLIYLVCLNANAVLLFTLEDVRVIPMTLCEIVFFALTSLIYKKMYKKASVTLVNNMCMLLCVGFVILTRLDIEKAMRQLIFASAALFVTALIPLFVKKMKFLNRLSFIYAAIGVLGLGVVTIAGTTEYGAKLSLSIGSISVQPSEFIKILFVFFVASILYDLSDMSQLLYVTGVAALHVLLLVLSRDLGGAAIFLLTYLCMIYVATQKASYLVGGLGILAVGAVASYFLFSHVRNRVVAWLDPLSVIDDQGYQVSQSLFAIGTGGWLGSGLGKGMPNKIPVVSKDFVFAAISEEMGGVFALCLILICVCCLLMFFNIALVMKDMFYKLVALGLAVVYGTQMFLAIGGVLKFIPSTGVTLSLVSYGGSSLFATMILFAVIQGLYILQTDREREYTDEEESQ